MNFRNRTLLTAAIGAVLMICVLGVRLIDRGSFRKDGGRLNMTAEQVRSLIPKNATAEQVRQVLGKPHEWWNAEDVHAQVEDESDATVWEYHCRIVEGRRLETVTIFFQDSVVSTILSGRNRRL
jgi:hypothetical protein